MEASTNTTPNNTQKQAALNLAERGCPVFPLHSAVHGKCTCHRTNCDSVGKHPRTKNGLKAATCDAEQITKWWTKWPDANIGLVTGAASGTLVIDIDPRHGGDESMMALELEHGKLPATVESLTGGGGRHLVFAHPCGIVKNRSSVRPGIDVRGDGGYIVAPPSLHVSGNLYVWFEGRALGDIELTPLPQWLHKLITEPAAPRASAPQSSSPATLVPDDGRSTRCLQSLLRIKSSDSKDGSKRLYSAACRCVEHDLTESEAVACIRSYETAKPFPRPYTGDEIIARLRDAENRAERGAALKKNKPAKQSGGECKRDPSQSQLLIVLAEAAELWQTPEGECFATVKIDEHVEHYLVRSRQFRLWLDHRFFKTTGGAPNSEARQSALGVIEAKARYEGHVHPIFLRVARYGDSIYIDIADAKWRAIEVTADGWRIVANPPVRFRRAKAMLPMPIPVAGGSMAELRRFLNVSDEQYPLVVAWLVAALCPLGPYPVLCLNGEQGSGKSNQARKLRSLIDPNTAPLRSEPKTPHDLMIAANNGWLVALDNLSRIPSWLSDCLCRLSTGGGFSTKTLYENDEETIFNATRPVIITGIEEVATRGDLIDRLLLVSLPTIPEQSRRPEAKLLAEFNQALPRIFGALLDAVACAIRNLPATKLDRLPRMADFALWATAAESAMGLPAGGFMRAYTANRENANEIALESSPVAKYIIEVADGGGFSGTSSELLELLNERAGHERADGKPGRRPPNGWPNGPTSLSGTLKRLAPNLRKKGIEVSIGRTGKSRSVTIAQESKASNVTGVTSVISPENPVFSSDAIGDAIPESDASRHSNVTHKESLFPEENGVSDASDVSDAKFYAQSAVAQRTKLTI